MVFLCWTTLILGLLGAISMALSGAGLLAGEAGDAADAADGVDAGDILSQLEGLGAADAVGDVADVADLADVADAGDAMEAAGESAGFAGQLQSAELGKLTQLLDQSPSDPRWRGITDKSAPHRAPHKARLSPFSSFSLFSFLAAFGATGLGTLRIAPSTPTPIALVVAVGVALVVAVLLWMLLNKLIGGFESDSTVSTASVEGRLAEVLSTIRPGAMGPVAFEAGGSRMTAAGKNIGPIPLIQGTKVRLGPRGDFAYEVHALTATEIEYLAVLASVDAHLDDPPVALERE